MNQANREKHLKVCGRKRKSSRDMFSYFGSSSSKQKNSSPLQPPEDLEDVQAVVQAAVETLIQTVVSSEDGIDVHVGTDHDHELNYNHDNNDNNIDLDSQLYAENNNIDEIDTSTQHVPSPKCAGYVVALVNQDDIYSDFPFTVLPQLNIVFENGRFHTFQCASKNYNISEPDPENSTTSKSCSMLAHSPPFMKVLQNMTDNCYYKTHANHKNCSHKRLGQRVEHYKQLYDEKRLTAFNLAKKYHRLDQTLELHQRFLLLIKENNIRRLHDVVKVALNSKTRGGMRYIINRIQDALDGIYTPQYSQDDKDIASHLAIWGTRIT